MADEKKPATTTTPKVPAPTTAASISFDQFTESTMAAVLRAANAQRLGNVPIVIGIIFHPGLGGSGSGGYGGQPSCGFSKITGRRYMIPLSAAACLPQAVPERSTRMLSWRHSSAGKTRASRLRD